MVVPATTMTVWTWSGNGLSDRESVSNNHRLGEASTELPPSCPARQELVTSKLEFVLSLTAGSWRCFVDYENLEMLIQELGSNSCVKELEVGERLRAMSKHICTVVGSHPC